MYKLVAVDLDGTLLNSYGEVSQKTRQGIKQAVEKGVEFVLASGRPISSVEDLANDIGANHFLISGNGAVAYDITKKEIIRNKFLTKDQVLEIIDFCDQNSVYYNIYTESEVITKALNYNTLFYHKENANKQEEKRTSISIISDIKDYILKAENENYLKITVCDNDKSVFDSIIRRLRMIEGIDVLDVAHMSKKIIKTGTEQIPLQYYYTEITNENVNKWFALEAIMEKLNISKDEVIGVGDNINDKELIENAGLGVAMGNSAPYIKDMADVVVADNNSDGVLEVLKKYVL